jgi:selenocysteine-specific elongation factor
LDEFEQLLVGTPEDILFQTAQKLGASSLDKIIKASGLEKEQAVEAAEILIKEEAFIELNGRHLILPANQLFALMKAIKSTLERFHQDNPLRPGMSREQLKSQIGIAPVVFDAIISQMSNENILEEISAELRIMGYQVRFTEAQQEKIRSLMEKFNADPYAPPSYKQSVELIGEDLVNSLIDTGRLIQLNEEVLLQQKIFQEMESAVISHIQENEAITLAELRDKYNTSRKYALAVLEYLDLAGVTVRKGDIRKLRRK